MLSHEHFVPMDKIALLEQGSYESILDEVTAAIEGRFGEDVSILATHDKFVAVMVDEGFYGIPWTIGQEGIELGEAAPLDIEVMNPLRAADYVWGQARKAVDLMADGKLDESRNQLRGLLSCMKPEYLAPEKLAESAFAESLGQERAWMKFYSERANEVRKYCYGRVGKVENRRIKPKFKKLIGGGIPATEEIRHDIVVALRALESRAGDIRKGVSGIEMPTNEGLPEAQVETMGTISGLHTDLIDAIESACNDLGSLVRLSSRTGDVVELAKIHDEVAERLYDMDLVHEFVARAAERLNKELQA